MPVPNRSSAQGWRFGSKRPGAADAAVVKLEGLKRALALERPQCVIHLAAEIASQRSEQKIRAVNVAGTERLLDACTALADAPREAALTP